MALIHKITDALNIDLDRKAILVKDITGTYGFVSYQKADDGYYEPITNTTGYGSPNPPRSNTSLFLLAYIRKIDGDIELPVTPYDPETVTDFEIIYNSNGWIIYDLVAVENSTAPIVTNYTEGAVTYDIFTKRLLKRVNGAWVVIKPYDLKNTSYVKASSDLALVVDLVVIYNNLGAKMEIMRFHSNSTTPEISSAREEFDRLRGLVKSALLNFVNGNKFVFQKMIEHLERNHC